MRRLPGEGSGQSAVSRAGGPSWPGVAAAAAPGLDGRGVPEAGVGEEGGDGFVEAGAVEGIGVEVAEDDGGFVGKRRGATGVVGDGGT